MAFVIGAASAQRDMRRPDNRILGRRWWRLWALTANFIVLAAICVAWHSPIWKLASVDYRGPEEWEQIARECVAVPTDSNFLHVDVAAIQSDLNETFGSRAEARVKLRLPDAICLRVDPVVPELWTGVRDGLRADGVPLADPLITPTGPIWRPTDSEKSLTRRIDSREAVGSWATMVAADHRFRDRVSELHSDGIRGWELTAVDGMTCIVLGRTRIGRRSEVAGHFLSQADSLLVLPCRIDLRFDGQVIVWPGAQRRGLNDGRLLGGYQSRAGAAEKGEGA